MNLNTPIPTGRSVEGWKNVAIEENGEPLVLLNSYAPDRISVEPQYHLQNIPNAISDCYCREGVASRLLHAAKAMPNGYKFLIWDAWRPVEVQHELFEFYKNDLQKRTGLTGDALQTETQKYVSLPSIDELRPSPHLTGGAVDLTITASDGSLLNMGTIFDYFGNEAQTDYFETKSNNSKKDLEIRRNRRFLYNLLIAAGFTNYPHEWWHFDYGNQFWAVQGNRMAIYNKTNPSSQ